MGMKFSSEESDEDIVSDINMTPLIDIMLVLLIIFMVTSSIATQSGLEIDLPEAASGKEGDSETKAVLVSLGRSGLITVQGQRVLIENLQSLIEEQLKLAGTKFVVFEGDESANLGLAVKVMDMAKLAGAERFAIATDKADVGAKGN